MKTLTQTVIAAAALAAIGTAAYAQPARAPAGQRSQFPDLATGEQIYKGICQGCHMPDAKGAAGAGVYPALAKNPKLGAPAYPAMVVIRGQKAMPSFGDALTDVQVAEVVNYVRSSFGNTYKDKVAAADVAPLHPAR